MPANEKRRRARKPAAAKKKSQSSTALVLARSLNGGRLHVIVDRAAGKTLCGRTIEIDIPLPSREMTCALCYERYRDLGGSVLSFKEEANWSSRPSAATRAKRAKRSESKAASAA